METVAQIVGLVAFVCAIMSFQQRTHRYILALQLSADILFTIHFCLLGAYTGAVLNGIAALRASIFVNKGKKWADNIIWFIVFCLLSIVAGAFTWDGIVSILPILGMICTTIAYWIKTPKYVRMAAFPSSPLWLVYNVINKSYGGVITEVISMISIIVAMIRLDFRKEKKEIAAQDEQNVNNIH